MSKSNRNSTLDTLRGIAILLVMGVHFNFFGPQHSVITPFEALWRRVGLVGVDLFFVLSGFLIGSLLLTEMNTHSRLNIPRFLIRRGFKLYPVYYTFLGYTILMAALKASVRGAGFPAALAAQVREFLPSLAFVQNYIPPNPAAHTWSLAVEEHFYLLLPLLMVALGAERIWKYLIPLCLSFIPICLGLRIVAVLQQQANAPVEIGTSLNIGQSHFHFDALLTGVALAVLALKYPERFIKLGRYPQMLILSGVSLWVIAAVPYHWVFFWGTFGFTLRILGSAAILLGACGRRTSPAKRRGFLAWIGANSYAIYVWHVTVMGTSEKFLIFRFIEPLIPNEAVRWLVMAAAVVACAVLAGTVVTKVVERPTLALRDRWFPSLGRAVVVPNVDVAVNPALVLQQAMSTVGQRQ